jgi:GAF domain-containing protein
MAIDADDGTPANVLADPDRLRSLQRVCVDAEPDEAFDRFARMVKSVLNVPIALVSLVTDQRQFFPGQAGLEEPLSSKRETPLSHSFCQHTVIDGIPKIFPDARIYAEVRDNLAIPDMGVVAYAGFPLKDSDGRVLGSLCAIDMVPRPWTKQEMAILGDLAEACSSELRLRISRDVADEARVHAEAAHDQLRMLSELTQTLAGTLDVEDALGHLAEAVTPRLADWCVISLVDKSGTIRNVGAAHHDAARSADVARFNELMLGQLQPNSLLHRVYRSGEPIRSSGATEADIRERTTNEEIIEITLRLGYGAHLTVPITAPVSQRVLGTISLVNGHERPAFTEADERTAVDIGRRAGLAIDNSRMYGQQRHVAEVLQQSMLTSLPDIADVELHARYLPAQDGAAVGGDWYDAFEQPDGSVMLAVGDVAGHDIEAAATMGQLRNLVRGDAYGSDDEAGPLLTQVDRAVQGLRIHTAATAVLARVRRDAGAYTVHFSNAGHPPPLLLLPDGTVEVWWTPVEPLLGLASRAARATHECRVPAGATLLFYTDGLVEDPRQLIDVGIERLRSTLEGGADVPGEELCARLLAGATRRVDDIALLLIRF